MSSSIVLTIALGILLLLGIGVALTSVRRSDTSGLGVLSRETKNRDRNASKAARELTNQIESESAVAIEATPSQADEPWVEPDSEAIGFSRRQFFNRATVTLMSAGLGGFGAAVIAFLWKGAEGGFGSKIAVGKLEDVISQIRSDHGFLYLPEARSWVTEYPKEAISKAEAVYGKQGTVTMGMTEGVVALYQKCPHLGCRVPNCVTSQWFECPCHGSQYNRVGEKKGGPAPRGMDRFAVSVTDGMLSINTGMVVAGPPIGTNTTGHEAEGPHCIGGVGGH